MYVLNNFSFRFQNTVVLDAEIWFRSINTLEISKVLIDLKLFLSRSKTHFSLHLRYFLHLPCVIYRTKLMLFLNFLENNKTLIFSILWYVSKDILQLFQQEQLFVVSVWIIHYSLRLNCKIPTYDSSLSSLGVLVSKYTQGRDKHQCCS